MLLPIHVSICNLCFHLILLFYCFLIQLVRTAYTLVIYHSTCANIQGSNVIMFRLNLTSCVFFARLCIHDIDFVYLLHDGNSCPFSFHFTFSVHFLWMSDVNIVYALYPFIMLNACMYIRFGTCGVCLCPVLEFVSLHFNSHPFAIQFTPFVLWFSFPIHISNL